MGRCNRGPGARYWAVCAGWFKFQGPLNGGVSNGGVSRSGLVLPFCPFLFFLGLSWGYSRFVRGLSGIFPDWSFSSFSAYYQHLRGTVPKGSATQSGPFPKKVGNTRVWKAPGLASLKSCVMFRIWTLFGCFVLVWQSADLKPAGFAPMMVRNLGLPDPAERKT